MPLARSAADGGQFHEEFEMNSQYEAAVMQLKERYKTIFQEKNGRPEWAVRKTGNPRDPLHCPVPFVGRQYFDRRMRLLLYASAENLTWYGDGRWDDDERAIDRHRILFEETKNDGDVFPSVHIAPVNNGCLLTAAFYVASKLAETEDMTPSMFLETISVGNYCKYTIQSGRRNQDYASNREFLAESHEYLEADMEILRPDCIILPSMIYKTDREFFDGIRGNAAVIPIWQINAGTINRLFARRYEPREPETLETAVRRWYHVMKETTVRGRTGEHYLSVFPYLDEVMALNEKKEPLQNR